MACRLGEMLDDATGDIRVNVDTVRHQLAVCKSREGCLTWRDGFLFSGLLPVLRIWWVNLVVPARSTIVRWTRCCNTLRATDDVRLLGRVWLDFFAISVAQFYVHVRGGWMVWVEARALMTDRQPVLSMTRWR